MAMLAIFCRMPDDTLKDHLGNSIITWHVYVGWKTWPMKAPDGRMIPVSGHVWSSEHKQAKIFEQESAAKDYMKKYELDIDNPDAIIDSWLNPKFSL